MNAPKVTDVDYIQFLIAAQRVYTCTEAARCVQAASHDAFTRLLTRQPPDTAALWQEVEPLVRKGGGLLVVDDSTLDKPHARKMGLVSHHWSGKHHRVVPGINLTTLLWTDGTASLPCDCRLYEAAADKKQQVTKNDHFQAMLQTAKERGFAPEYVCFDGWYSGLKNLKAVQGHGWHRLTRLKHNRLVDPDGSGNAAVSDLDLPAGGGRVHLMGYGFIFVFRIVTRHGGTEQAGAQAQEQAEHWATSDLSMTEPQRQELSRQCFAIENYHRALKQCCGVERAQVRKAEAQKYHILLSLRAYVRLEANRLKTGVSGYAAKAEVVREAIRQYLRRPTIQLEPTA